MPLHTSPYLWYLIFVANAKKWTMDFTNCTGEWGIAVQTAAVHSLSQTMFEAVSGWFMNYVCFLLLWTPLLKDSGHICPAQLRVSCNTHNNKGMFWDYSYHYCWIKLSLKIGNWVFWLRDSHFYEKLVFHPKTTWPKRQNFF